MLYPFNNNNSGSGGGGGINIEYLDKFVSFYNIFYDVENTGQAYYQYHLYIRTDENTFIPTMNNNFTEDFVNKNIYFLYKNNENYWYFVKCGEVPNYTQFNVTGFLYVNEFGDLTITKPTYRYTKPVAFVTPSTFWFLPNISSKRLVNIYNVYKINYEMELSYTNKIIIDNINQDTLSFYLEIIPKENENINVKLYDVENNIIDEINFENNIKVFTDRKIKYEINGIFKYKINKIINYEIGG